MTNAFRRSSQRVVNGRAHLTLKSRNKKVGRVPVSTTSSSSCPTDCPFKGNGCYAALGPLALFWHKVDAGEAGNDWDTFCGQVADLPDGQFWRHNQAGDLPGDGVHIDIVAMSKLIAANKGKRGFTYTHYDAKRGPTNSAVIEAANRDGFTINLSANNLDHSDELSDLDIGPVVVVLPIEYQRTSKSKAWTESLAAYRQRLKSLPASTQAGRKIAVCPATYSDDVSCATCQLCQRQDRKVIVGFPAHGAAKRKASAVAEAA